jgi:NAD(P)-dependent dehydrogenase (short-subunit alcohol dehydrogenase family)
MTSLGSTVRSLNVVSDGRKSHGVATTHRTGVLNYQAMEINLDGQIALVTGAGAGIGQGIAEALAESGAGVVVADIDSERAEVTMDRIKARGGRGTVVATDVTVPAQISHAVTTAVDRFGRLDVLVNNAGGVRFRPFLEQDERSWRRHIDLNLVSVLAGVSAAAATMIDGGRGGSIVNVASIEGLRAAPNYGLRRLQGRSSQLHPNHGARTVRASNPGQRHHA